MKNGKWLWTMLIFGMLSGVFADGQPVDKEKFDEAAWKKQVEELKAQDMADADVQLRLGLLLLQDKSDKSVEHQKEGFELLKKSADQGNSSALFQVAKCYREGKGTGRDDALAYECFRQVADDEGAKEYLDATFHVGMCLLEGLGVAKDADSAIEWIREAADNGFVPAQYQMGMINIKGEVATHNLEQAIQYFQKAAEQEHVESQVILGIILINEDIVKDRQTEGMKWLLKAAGNGHVIAQLIVGYA